MGDYTSLNRLYQVLVTGILLGPRPPPPTPAPKGTCGAGKSSQHRPSNVVLALCRQAMYTYMKATLKSETPAVKKNKTCTLLDEGKGFFIKHIHTQACT